MGKKIGIIVGIITILSSMWYAICLFDGHYAKAADQQADHQLLRDKVDSDHLRLLRERKWQMEKEFPVEATRPPSVDKQIKEYVIDEKTLEQKLGGRNIQ